MNSLSKRLERRFSKKFKQDDEKSIVAKVFTEYCSSTSIHGIGYLGAEDKSIIEKVWWLLVFLISVCVCIFLIFNTWTKWNENPVIISYSQEPTPIWQIPFPAVTICPMNKIKQPVYNYTEAFHNYKTLSTEEKKIFHDMSLICDVDWLQTDSEYTNETADDTAIYYIMQAAPTRSETIIGYKWKRVEHFSSDEDFAPVMTEEGLCFTFNILNSKNVYTDEVYLHEDLTMTSNENKNWTLEDGYPEDSPLHTYPRRAVKNGIHAGLTIALMSQTSEREYACGMPVAGFKIILHNPAETPKVEQDYILVPVRRQIVIAVTPSLTTTSRRLISIDPKIRRCFFSHEKVLRFYKTYTQDNCRTECMVNLTVSQCGCVPFLLPRDNNTKICSHKSRGCIENIEHFKLTFEMALKMKNKKWDFNSTLYEQYKKCNCMPSCHSLTYSAETSQAKLFFTKSVEARYNESLSKDVEVTFVDIFFKQSYFLSMRRTELYGQTDFLANCGGLLGLFMGFSILSLIEIIYFATLRFWLSLKNRNKLTEVNRDKMID